jgi:hypothetical protein
VSALRTRLTSPSVAVVLTVVAEVLRLKLPAIDVAFSESLLTEPETFAAAFNVTASPLAVRATLAALNVRFISLSAELAVTVPALVEAESVPLPLA